VLERSLAYGWIVQSLVLCFSYKLTHKRPIVKTYGGSLLQRYLVDSPKGEQCILYELLVLNSIIEESTFGPGYQNYPWKCKHLVQLD